MARNMKTVTLDCLPSTVVFTLRVDISDKIVLRVLYAVKLGFANLLKNLENAQNTCLG